MLNAKLPSMSGLSVFLSTRLSPQILEGDRLEEFERAEGVPVPSKLWNARRLDAP